MAVRPAKFLIDHRRALAVSVLPLVAAVFSDYGRSLLFPDVNIAIERGRESGQISEVWLKLTNSAVFSVHNVVVTYPAAIIVFANLLGVQIEGETPALVETRTLAPGQPEEFSAFENVHSYSFGDKTALGIGSPSPSQKLFVYERNTHKPSVEAAPGSLVSHRSPVIEAEVEIKVRFATALRIPKERSFRLVGTRDAVGNPVWRVVSGDSSLKRGLSGRHIHLIKMRPERYDTGSSAPKLFDGHITLHIPLDQLAWPKPKGSIKISN
jgi:hypothetical protein